MHGLCGTLILSLAAARSLALAYLSERIFEAAANVRPTRLQQAALAKIAKITARRTFDEIDGELEKAHFPGIIDTLNNGAERFICALDAALGTIDHSVDRIAHRLLAKIGFAELKTVTKHRDVSRVFTELIYVALRFFSETFQQEPAIVFWCKDLRSLCVNFTIANPDLINAI